MDYLSRCYSARVRPFRDSDATVMVRWYFCKPGAKLFPGRHVFGSQVWREVAVEPPDQAGELFGPKPYDPGYNPGYVGQCHVGPDDWFAEGVPVAALGLTPDPLPPCCYLPAPEGAGEVGGWRGWSRTGQAPRWGVLGGWSALAKWGAELGDRGGWAGVAVSPALLGGLGGWSGQVVLAGGLGGLGGWRGVSTGGFQGQWGLRGSLEAFLMSAIRCSVRQTTAQGIPSAVGTILNFQTVEYDPAGMYSALTPSRITVPQDGLYVVTHRVFWNSVPAGSLRASALFVNGVYRDRFYAGVIGDPFDDEPTAAVLALLSAGDYLEVQEYQAGGTTQAPVSAGTDGATFRVALLEPPGVAAYGQSHIASATVSTSTGVAGEIHSSLRVTVTVPSSGRVIVRQSAIILVNAIDADAILLVQVDGAGAWTTTGSIAFNTGEAGQNHTVVGEVELTGLTPGPHTFYMGWLVVGGHTLTIQAGTRGGSQSGTWQSVTTLP